MALTDHTQSQSVVETLDRALSDIAQARAYNEWLFDRARQHLGRRVLDAGAGLGTFTALARAEGASVVAAEPEAEFAEYLRGRFADDDEVEVVHGTAEDLRRSDFDSIICFNVLEHIEDDVTTLRSFVERLVSGGRVLLLVPAHPRLYGGYDRAAGHVRRYRGETLRRSLTEAGFDVERLRYVNPVGALGWLVRVRLRASEEWPSTSFGAFDRLVPLLRPLDRVPLPFGLSLWAVARRP